MGGTSKAITSQPQSHSMHSSLHPFSSEGAFGLPGLIATGRLLRCNNLRSEVSQRSLPFLCRGLFHKSLLVLLALSRTGSPRLRIASCHTLAKSTALNKSAAPLDARLRLSASEHGQHNPGLYPPPAQSCKHRTFVCGAEFTHSSPTE